MEPLTKLENAIQVTNVPFVSQIGAGADQHNKDCGAACGSMIVQAYTGKAVSVDDFYNKSGVIYDQNLFFSQIRDVIKSFGLITNYEAGVTGGRLYEIISSNIPAIALIQYSILVKAGLTQKTDFLGAHFVVVTGFNADKIFIHDPYTTQDAGKNLAVPAEKFLESWKGDGSNLVNSLIYPAYPIGDPKAISSFSKSYSVTSVNGLYIRKVPGVLTDANKLGALSFGDKVEIESTKIVNSVLWGKLAGREAWVSMAYLKAL